MNAGEGTKVEMTGKVAYASQRPWILNDTVKQNILFGLEYDETRYAEAIHLSCLEPDLKLFQKGD